MVSAITYNKQLFICLHMEQVFNDYKSQLINNEESLRYMSKDQLSKSTIASVKEMISTCKMYKDCDEVIIDFNGIKSFQSNEWATLYNLLKNNKKIIAVNYEQLMDQEKINQLNNLSKKKDTTDMGYMINFENKSIDVVDTITAKDINYKPQNGIKLTSYINIKKIIEDEQKFFRWCYILSKKIYENKNFKKLNKKIDSERPILLCHTLNGTSIAVIVSKLLDLDICFINHLGPYSKLSNYYFDDNIQQTKNYIIVVDMICLGNEIIRARDIVEFLGGQACGYISFVDLGLSNIGEKESKMREWVLKVSNTDAKEKLGYKIMTDLCCQM